MSDRHYDQLEVRDPAQRELAQFNLLPDLVRLAMDKAPGWAAHLKGVDAASVTSRPALAKLPVLRKSALKDLNVKENVSFLLAEQNTNMALKYARHGYILENGRVVMDGDAKALSENEDVKEFYLGIAEGKRKSFRDVKHYKRRKRWLA